MMFSIGKMLAAAAILAASAASLAQPQEPYGTNWEYAREHKYQVSIAPFTSADSWVSGTKVDFAVSAGFVAVEPNPQTPLTMWSRIDKHSEVLYEMLKMTHTLEEAVEMADDLYPIHYEPYDPNQDADNTDAGAPMKIHGDTKATISGVYDGQNTPSEQTRPWFKVIS